MPLNDAIKRLIEIPGREARYSYLQECVKEYTCDEINHLAERLKEEVVNLIMGDTEKALDIAESLLDLAELTEDPLHLALGLRMKGLAITQAKGDFQGAISLYAEAASIHRAHHDPRGEALVYMNEIWALSILGRHEEAIQKGEWAKDKFDELGDRFSSAKMRNNLALVYHRKGEFHQSLRLLEQMLSLYQEFGKDAERFLSAAENNRALNLCYIGHFSEAIEAGERAVQWGENHNQPTSVARAKHNLGMALSLQGHYTRALTLYEEARVLHGKLNQPHDVALCKLSAMASLIPLRRFEEIIQMDHEIRPIFRQLKMYKEEGQSILFCANAYSELRRFDEAVLAHQQARSIYEQEGNLALIGRCDLGRAWLYFQMGDYLNCEKLAKEVADFFKSSGLQVYYGLALVMAVQAALVASDFQQGEQLLNNIKDLVEEDQWAELNYQYFQLFGDISAGQNRISEAFNYYEQAIHAIENLRGNIMVEYRSNFIEDKQNIYGKVVDLYIKCDNPERGFHFAERAKSRALLELLAYRPDLSIRARDSKDEKLVEELNELREQREMCVRHGSRLVVKKENDNHNEIVKIQQEIQTIENRITSLWHQLLLRDADYARDASLWEIREDDFPQVPSNSLLVEFFSIRDHWVVFLIFPEETQKSVHAVRLSVTSREIENWLKRYHTHLGLVARSLPPNIENLIPNAKNLLHQLYTLLIAPIVPAISTYTNLIIVPHGPLHYVPFHALYDGESYLIEKYQISHLPAAGLLGNPADGAKKAAGTLVLGHSFNGSLPNTVEEARLVAELWNGKAHYEEKANTHAFFEEAENYRLIHLACHADFRADNPLFSGLSLENGWLTTLDVFNLHLNASLVTLSACQTGRSVIGGGDELLGLMRAFLFAGVDSLLLTHWPVTDESTPRFMKNFYQSLKDGQTKGAALRSAQKLFISSDGVKKYQHPYFWAPFYLVGQDNLL